LRTRPGGIAPIACYSAATLPQLPVNGSRIMTDRTQILDTIKAQIEPFNKKGVALTEATTFQGDLEWDSLTVMDFVAAIEDEFDIIITMNMQAEIENIGQLADAVAKLKADQA
jgi:acyl carrier protein